MATRLRYNDGYNVDVEADGDLGNDNSYVNEIINDVKVFSNYTPLQYFHVRTVGDHLVYEFMSVDNRKWQQKLRVINEKDYMTFDVVDYWELPEFSLQRPIREKIFILIRLYQLTRFDMDF